MSESKGPLKSVRPIGLQVALTICQCASCLHGEPRAGHCFAKNGALRHWCAATKRAGMLPEPPAKGGSPAGGAA